MSTRASGMRPSRTHKKASQSPCTSDMELAECRKCYGVTCAVGEVKNVRRQTDYTSASEKCAVKKGDDVRVKTISMCQGKGSLSHNNRDFSANNIDRSRTKDNIVFVCENLKAAYDKLLHATTPSKSEATER